MNNLVIGLGNYLRERNNCKYQEFGPDKQTKNAYFPLSN